MVQLAQLTRHPVGYSDHTLDVFNAPLLAKHMGASVLEKHFNPFDYTDTPDAPHSLNTADFKDMVAAIAGELKPIGPTPAELPMLLRHKRRWVVTGYAAPGEMVTAALHRMKRDDTDGMHPLLEMPRDARATRPLFPGDALKRTDLG
jgi:sialic acid synthase SpsE